MTTLYLGEMSKGERQCRCCPHHHKFGWQRLTGIGGIGSALRPELGVEISPQGPGAGQGAVRYGNAGLGRARRRRARLGQCKAQQGKVFLVT